MRSLLEDFESFIDLDYCVNGKPLGDSITRLLDDVQSEIKPVWGISGIASEISTMQKECMHFFYRPHLYPEMDKKLELAHKLQYHLLPTSCPQIAPVHLSTVLESYCQLSGDLLGWRFCADDSFLFWILDISGHGLKAGLLCAVLKTIIDQIETDGGVEDFVYRLNALFMDALTMKDELFYATGVFINVKNDGSAEHISAAHPQVFLRKRGEGIRELASTGIPIGLYEKRTFDAAPLSIRNGDMFLLYTDGVTEAENQKNELFGYDRVKKILTYAYEYPEEVTTALYKSLSKFQAMEYLSDDVTFLAAKVK